MSDTEERLVMLENLGVSLTAAVVELLETSDMVDWRVYRDEVVEAKDNLAIQFTAKRSDLEALKKLQAHIEVVTGSYLEFDPNKIDAFTQGVLAMRGIVLDYIKKETELLASNRHECAGRD
jgi:hypothetical protein